MTNADRAFSGEAQGSADRQVVGSHGGQGAVVNAEVLAGPVERMDDPVERGERAAAWEAGAGDQSLPGGAEFAHRAGAPAPLIEIAHHDRGARGAAPFAVAQHGADL